MTSLFIKTIPNLRVTKMKIYRDTQDKNKKLKLCNA